jgi:hypothetical protein
LISAAETISPASLLLTATTVLYGLWRGQIEEAVDVPIPAHLEDAALERKLVAAAIGSRVLPLLAATTLVLIAFTPILVSSLGDTVDIIRAKGWQASENYDPAIVALLGVVTLLAILEVTLLSRLCTLVAKRKRLVIPT